jgi:hypothetical protein
MNIVNKIIASLFVLLIGFSATAQENLEIEKIFEDYGKRDGSILIELAKDVLGKHTKISKYKCLIIPYNTQIADACLVAISEDTKNGSAMLESKRNGKIETAYYCLSDDENNAEYEYILFNSRSKKITLIYVKGNFAPDKLEIQLDKLKDLFLKVNNKQIKF